MSRVIGVWRQSGKGSDPSPVEVAKFRELRNQRSRDDGADPLDAAKARSLIAQVVLCLDEGLHLCLGFRLVGLQDLDVLQDIPSDPLVFGHSQAVLLGDNHGSDIVTMGCEIRQTLAFSRSRACRNQFQRAAHLGQDMRIDAITLGQTPGCACKFASLPGIHARRVSPGVGQRFDDWSLIAARSFEDDDG